MISTRRRIPGWLALWALVWHALAPTLAHALVPPASGRGETLEICSSTGVVTIAWSGAAADGAPGAPQTTYSLHCDWCQLSGADVALPPASAGPNVSAGTADVPRLALTGWALPSHWRPAAPRGPPLA